jgi:hypothetical protein
MPHFPNIFLEEAMGYTSLRQLNKIEARELVRYCFPRNSLFESSQKNFSTRLSSIHMGLQLELRVGSFTQHSVYAHR